MNRKVYEAELVNAHGATDALSKHAVIAGALVEIAEPTFQAIENVVKTIVTANRDVAMLREQSNAELAKMGLEAQEAADIRAKKAELEHKKVESYTQLAKTALENDAPEAFHTLLDKISEAGV